MSLSESITLCAIVFYAVAFLGAFVLHKLKFFGK